MRTPSLIAAFALATAAQAAETTHYLDLVNTADHSVSSFAVARAGSGKFHEIFLGDKPLQGGGDATTVAIRGEGNDCLRDLRLRFTDGRVLMQRNFDVCKYRSYHTGQYLRAHDRSTLVAQP